MKTLGTRVGYSQGLGAFIHRTDIPADIQSKIEQGKQIWIGEIGKGRHCFFRHDHGVGTYGFDGKTETEYYEMCADIYPPIESYVITNPTTDDLTRRTLLMQLRRKPVTDLDHELHVIEQMRRLFFMRKNYFRAHAPQMSVSTEQSYLRSLKALGQYLNTLIKRYNDTITATADDRQT